MENDKKEQAAMIVGLFLILLVILITLFRSNVFSGSNESNTNDQSSSTVATLGYKTINATDLQKKILLPGKDSGLILLDIRPFSEYAAEHIVDAINITPDEFPLDSKIDAHTLIIIVGANASDTNISTTVAELKKETFTNFMVLANGMEAWKQSAGATVTYGDPTSFVDQAKVSYVEADQLNAALKQNVATYIIDVRTTDEYNKGHIPGAINIPSDDLEKRRREITEKRVVVAGMNELQEFQSSVQMYDMLLVSPFILKGAMPGWQQKGFSIIK